MLLHSTLQYVFIIKSCTLRCNIRVHMTDLKKKHSLAMKLKQFKEVYTTFKRLPPVLLLPFAVLNRERNYVKKVLNFFNYYLKIKQFFPSFTCLYSQTPPEVTLGLLENIDLRYLHNIYFT